MLDHVTARRERELSLAEHLNSMTPEAATRAPPAAHSCLMQAPTKLARAGRKRLPTVVFFDSQGREAFRCDGYMRPFHVESAFDYVASGAFTRQPQLQRFSGVAGRARLRPGLRPVAPRHAAVSEIPKP